MAGNLSLDPAFCAAPDANFDLQDDSPCRGHTPQSPNCDLMGAWPVGCQSAVPGVRAIPDPLNVTVSPNPASGLCRISFRTARAGNVEAAVFDPAGRMIRLLYGGWPGVAHGPPIAGGVADSCSAG